MKVKSNKSWRVGKLQPGARLALIMIITGLLGFGVWYASNNMGFDFGSSASASRPPDVPDTVPHVRVGVVTWGGYAGGQYYNKGFSASKESRFYTDQGILVSFVLIDDFANSRNAWKSDEIDLMWTTADAFTTETAGLKQFEPKIVFQSDWSRGGDAIVVNRTINSINDLRGKRVSVAWGTPSHTFLLRSLESAGLNHRDVEIIQTESAPKSAELFKAGKVDGAVVWSPDDEDLVQNVAGAKVLQSTKTASHIIADVFFAKKSYIDANKETLKKLVEGWMIGSAELNSDPAKKVEASKILADGLNQPESFCLKAINNVRLTTYGDNVEFFNLNGNSKSMTGEQLYRESVALFNPVGLTSMDTLPWREVIDTSVIRSVNLSGNMHLAEGRKNFTAPTAEMATTSGVSTRQVTISFEPNSSRLDQNAKILIDQLIVPIAKQHANSRFRVEGNTYGAGSTKEFSKARAKAVVDYLITQHSFDNNQFIVVGNGYDKPGPTPELSRRTDFIILGGN